MALLAQDLGAVVSASHNPPEYNGVKIFDREGRKLTDAEEEDIEALFDAPVRDDGSVEQLEGAGESYLNHVVERFGSDLSGFHVVVDCANGAFFELAPAAFATLGAKVTTIGVEPDGTNINDGCGAMDLAAVSRKVVEVGADLGVAFDGDGDRARGRRAGETLDGDQILAILAPALDIDLVAVTVMTNLGFHRLMDEHGIRS